MSFEFLVLSFEFPYANPCQISDFGFRISDFRTAHPLQAWQVLEMGAQQLKTKNSKLKTGSLEFLE
jgi:hypothetical protein